MNDPILASALNTDTMRAALPPCERQSGPIPCPPEIRFARIEGWR
jgi:hypothetical protein